MRTLPLVQLAAKQCWREARSTELFTLFFAVLIAVASSSTIAHFAERLHLAMQLRASEVLAADLVVSGSLPANAAMLEQGQQLGLDSAQTVEFASMLSSAEAMYLTSVKAVSDTYPLRGELKSTLSLRGEEILGGRPQRGEAWLDAQLLDRLSIQLGDSFEVGALPLVASRILTHEPDRSGGFAAFTPRALINHADLAATEAVQPGSRIRYRQLWAGDPQAVAQLQDWLADVLQPQHSIESLTEGSPQLSQALERAQQYLSLASLAAIVLASVSIALSASNFAGKRYDHAAMLRCFGLSRRQTLLLFVTQLCLLGMVASLLGLVLGAAAQHLLFALLADLLPANIPSAGMQASITALFTGMAALIGFALPPLFSLGRVSPLRVLKRDLQPMPATAWLIYGFAIAALAVMMWRFSLDLRLILIILGTGVLFAPLLGLIVLAALKQLSRRLAQRSLAWRLGLWHVLQKPVLAVGQILAFALILFAMALIVLLRTELLDTWQEQLPEHAPNHFAFNIMPHEQAQVSALLTRISPQPAAFYPMTPGRLTHINDQPVLERLAPDSRALSTVQRDLNLTWTEQLPLDNQVTAGRWWSAAQSAESTGRIEISVEAELAERLALNLGDQVSFNLGGRTVHTQVTSLRSVDWGSMQPNFFVIFAPNSLPEMAYTWITSFYLPVAQEQQLRELNQQFPAVSLLRIDAILEQLRSILAQVTQAIEFILLFVLAAGVVVLLAGVQSTLAHRIQQGALLRALGSRRALLRNMHLYEFATIGGVSGLLAWLACELASFMLYSYVFKLPWSPHLSLVSLPIIGALLICGAGLLGTRRVLSSSPVVVLRGD